MSGRNRSKRFLRVKAPSASRKLSINSDEDGKIIKAKAKMKKGNNPSQAQDICRVPAIGTTAEPGALAVTAMADLPSASQRGARRRVTPGAPWHGDSQTLAG